MFEWDGAAWGQVAKLVASDAQGEADFGRTLGTMDDTLVVGAAWDDGVEEDQGAVYVFRDTGDWTEEAKLVAPVAQPGDRFGSCVALAEGRIVVGALGGRAYVFGEDRAGWTFKDELVVSGAEEDDGWVESVAVSEDGTTVLVGTPYADFLAENSGAIHAFVQVADDEWVSSAEPLVPDGTEDEYFGDSVVLRNHMAVVGAPQWDVGGIEDAGRVFAFRDDDCNRNGIRDALDMSEGTSTDANCNGRPDECDTGADADCNENLIPDFCDILYATSEDCNENAIPDECDIESGASGDCNANETPDECEAGGESDCNYNLVPDLCDVFDGDSDDCNENSVPDECEKLHWPGGDRLTAPDADRGDDFGSSVDTSGEWMIVGAPYDYDAVRQGGSAYVLRRVGPDWTHDAKLYGWDTAEYDHFGSAVAVAGDVVVIGVSGDDDSGTSSGSAYVFRHVGGEWIEEDKLLASDGADQDSFGVDVAATNDRIVVGACWNDGGKGAVYVFEWDGVAWAETAKLTAPDATRWHYFGSGVGVAEDTILVGAYGADGSGAAYVFTYDGMAWTQSAKLTPVTETEDRFGMFVALNEEGTTAVVGAPRDDTACPGDEYCDSGALYVFATDPARTGPWQEVAKLVPAHSNEGDELGECDIHGNTIVGGAWSNDDFGYRSGAAYVFSNVAQQWRQTAHLEPLNGDLNEDYHFGCAVAVVDASTVVVGARGAGLAGVPGDAGAVYVFELVDGDCNENGAVDECDIEDGISEDCNANATPDECDIFVGTSQDVIPPGGDGTPDECQCELVASTPPECAVDARQPHSVNNTIPMLGWDSIELSFTCGTSATPSYDSADYMVSDPTLYITNVDVLGNTATVTFNRVITPGIWTCITYDLAPTPAKTCLGSLPADVNGDQTAAPADILTLIDCINGVATIPCDSWQVDADRDGDLGPADILRVVDLLNGAGSFDPWLYVSLPAQAECPVP